MQSSLSIALRVSKNNSAMAMRTALVLSLMTALAFILFVIVFNYHERFETLGELLRKPALAILGAYILGTSSVALLFWYRFFKAKFNNV